MTTRWLAGWSLIASLVAGCGGGSSSPNGAATSPTGGAGTPSATTADLGCGETDFRDRTLAALNQRRAAGAQCGASGSFPSAAPVSWHDSLAQAAYGHSKDMAERNYFAHENPEGGTLSMRIDATGYRWSSIGENIAKGSTSASETVDLWMTSDGHCKNIMTARFVHIGMACARSGNSARYYTLDLAAPR